MSTRARAPDAAVPHTLLLADDSPAIHRVIELTFADRDVRVVSVSDGSQALIALDRTPPDIVLVDVGMPGVSGYDVARHIKDTPKLAHIPVVLLTGAFEPVDSDRAAAAGCDAVLVKPFDPQSVVARVQELLPGSRTAAVSLPPLAGAFAALLTAEQELSASPAGILPSPSVSNREALVEEVTRRVLERLSDRLVQERVTEVVSAVAERLVREEIERIRKSIP